MDSTTLIKILIEQSLDILLVFRTDGSIIDANQAALDAYGYTKSQLLKKSIHDIRAEATQSQLSRQIQKVKKGPFRFEIVHRRKDGTEFPVETSWSFIDSDGEGTILSIIRDITERKRMEEASRESENRKTAILDCALDAIITMDHQGKVVGFNPAAESTFGIRPEEIIGQLLAEKIIPERLRPGHYQGLAHYLATGEGPVLNKRIEVLALHADGHEFPVELSINRIAGIEPPLFTATLREITERKQAEEALRERVRLAALRADVSTALVSGETLPAVLQHCAEALVKHLDAAFARVWTLKETENILELQASAGVYTHLNGPHGHVQVGEFKIGRIAQSRQPLLTNDVLNDPNISDLEWAKREGMVAFAGYPMTLEGRVLGVMAMFARHPLSKEVLNELATVADGIAQWVERKRAEEKLRESRATLEFILESAQIGDWDLDLIEDTATRSLRHDQCFGYTEPVAEWGSEIFLKHVHPDDLARVEREFNQAALGTADWHFECRVIWPDGSTHWIAAHGSIYRTQEGKPTRMLGIVMNITERKQAEEKLRDARDELELRVAERTAELAKINSDLVAEISQRKIAEEQKIALLQRVAKTQEAERSRIARDLHDQMGQRLTGLRLKIETLKMGVSDNDELSAGLLTLAEIGQTLDDDIGFLIWELRPTIIDELGLAAALESYVNEWGKRFVIPTTFTATGLGSHRLDPEMEINLYRIAQEALNNAAKYAGATHVDVLLQKSGDNITLIVEDNGAGFDLTKLSTSREAGHGFGLIGMQERTSLIAGIFEIESAQGSGTCISVKIPANSESQIMN